MKRQELKSKLFDLVDGNLSPEDEKEVIASLEKFGFTREEIDSIRSVNLIMDKTPLPEPSARMDERFYTLLEEERRKAFLGEPEIKQKRSLFISLLTPGLRIAAGIALFLLGWFAAGWLSSISPSGNKQIANLVDEVKQLKQTLVLTMMQQSSPVERIKAVNMASDLENADNQIIESLFGLLNNDSNNNVRLLALDALVQYSSVPEIREGLIVSISNQTSPLVQLRLAEIMLALNEKRAVPEFQKVLQNAGLNYSVRDKLNKAVVVLL